MSTVIETTALKMSRPQNIDKSGFHPGEYVGYGDGRVWRIRPILARNGKGTTYRRGWRATAQTGAGVASGRTLAEISQKINNPYRGMLNPED